MRQVGGIYQILHKGNGHRYIGSAVNLYHRWARHRSHLRLGRHCNAYLQNAWNLHGDKAFAFAALEYVPDLERLVEREQYYFDVLQPEYNIAPVAGSTLGSRCTEETKSKLSAALTGRVLGPHSEETKRRIGAANLGRVLGPQSEEHKRNISEANRGENNANAKLTEQDVREIMVLLEDGVLSQQQIADRYGVSRETVRLIKRRRTWAHVSNEGEVITLWQN
uniref:GIY-YIG domain-containing protein n=1 Tax=viral metagenome TaxID=1070528 RepID=A0A6M3IFD4_9ZZZZ